MANDFNLPSHLWFDPLSSFPGIPLIHPDVSHPRVYSLDRLQEQRDAFPVLEIGHTDNCFENQTGRINEHMSLAA
jgi:hypothetical protein